jgi:hypothetical protein
LRSISASSVFICVICGFQKVNVLFPVDIFLQILQKNTMSERNAIIGGLPISHLNQLVNSEFSLSYIMEETLQIYLITSF